MGAELGATTSVFPSDEATRQFLKAQNREEDFKPISADSDAVYDEHIVIDLSDLEPMAACPTSPDAVQTIEELKGETIDKVYIGSCTTSSYTDMMKAARILRGNRVAVNVSLVVAPGSKQVLNCLVYTSRCV